jgi:hypothetical protein
MWPPNPPIRYRVASGCHKLIQARNEWSSAAANPASVWLNSRHTYVRQFPLMYAIVARAAPRLLGAIVSSHAMHESQGNAVWLITTLLDHPLRQRKPVPSAASKQRLPRQLPPRPQLRPSTLTLWLLCSQLSRRFPVAPAAVPRPSRTLANRSQTRPRSRRVECRQREIGSTNEIRAGRRWLGH